MVRLNDKNGYGSTNTGVRRFLTTVTNVGTDITYTDSATNGASFTINTAGVYSISYTDNCNVAQDVCVSINATVLTGIPTTLSEVLFEDSTTGGDFRGCASGCAYLNVGDVIRAQTNGAAGGTTRTFFTIVRVA